MSGSRRVCLQALEIRQPCLTAVPDGVLHDMGMEGAVIPVVRVLEDSVQKPVGGKPFFRGRNSELEAFDGCGLFGAGLL